jgi:hypothetical protein
MVARRSRARVRDPDPLGRSRIANSFSSSVFRVGQNSPPIKTRSTAIGQFRAIMRAALNAVAGPPGIAKILPSNAIGACEMASPAAWLTVELVSDFSASIPATSSLCSLAETNAAAECQQGTAHQPVRPAKADAEPEIWFADRLLGDGLNLKLTLAHSCQRTRRLSGFSDQCSRNSTASIAYPACRPWH